MKAKTKQPMSKGKIAILAIIGAVLLVAIIYLLYYLIHVVWNKNYRKYLTDYVYETGKTYTALKDNDVKVKGFDLVAENDILKLYTDPSNGYVAVYDKRDGSVTYSNPLDADQDSKANGTNKEYLKSAFRLGYYNATATTGDFNSFSGCVNRGQLAVESIENGVRYLYTIGDYKPGDGVSIYFEIPLEYRLDGDSVVVNIPTDHIKEEGAGYVYRILLLQFFGAANKNETGYTVVPNASGSLIHFNNGKTRYPNYSQYYYDIDPLVASYNTLENTIPAKFSFYGICREDRTLLVNVEEGASISSVTSGLSGVYNDYNYTYSTFVLRNTDNLKMFGNATTDTYVMEDKFYDMNIQVRYTFITGEENTGYVGMANFIRNRLITDGTLSVNEKSNAIPFYYDIISGIRETEHILGKMTYRINAMTSFKEAEEIAEDLHSLGVERQVMNLQGWFNKGYYHNMPDRINVTAKLGGKHGLEELNEKMESLNGKLYADVAFQKASFDSDFNYSLEGSRYYGAGYAASFGFVNPTTLRNTYGLGYSENRYDVMSPKFLPHYVQKFAKKIQRYDVSGISLRDLGNYLASDKKRSDVINREDALDIVKAQLRTLDDTGRDLMINEANWYAFGYASDILNAPIEDNNYYLVDERIPLYGMIIHGCIDYSSNLLNFEDSVDLTPKLLQLVENGAAPHYVFTRKNSSEMKDTAMNRYYATTYETWKSEAVEAYAFVNGALKYVTNACITDHKIDGDLRKITYDNGVSIYVNYGKNAADMDGITVNGLSYRVEGVK
ncbi:MAG: hypothetical protein IJS80_02940 [Lachnospiraceae bacterium]|nr:hypothetical protein [Lachnospiraceae bacterium]